MSKEYDIPKLKGSENYHTWYFAMKNVLAYKGLEKTIVNLGTESDAKKLVSSKALLAIWH